MDKNYDCGGRSHFCPPSASFSISAIFSLRAFSSFWFFSNSSTSALNLSSRILLEASNSLKALIALALVFASLSVIHLSASFIIAPMKSTPSMMKKDSVTEKIPASYRFSTRSLSGGLYRSVRVNRKMSKFSAPKRARSLTLQMGSRSINSSFSFGGPSCGVYEKLNVYAKIKSSVFYTKRRTM